MLFFTFICYTVKKDSSVFQDPNNENNSSQLMSNNPTNTPNTEINPNPQIYNITPLSTESTLLSEIQEIESNQSESIEDHGDFNDNNNNKFNEDEKKIAPRLTKKESLAENDRLVEMAHENAEFLKKCVKFDSSISVQSSSNYFFDILELREKRNIFENSRLKMMLREAAGLVNRLKETLLKFVLKNVRTSGDLCDRNFSLVHQMRNDINENSWIFHMKPEHIIEVS